MAVTIGAKSRFSYVAESTWGTTPATPVMRVFNITGATLTPGRSLVESGEFQSDRSTPDPIHGTPFPGFSINVEMQAKSLGTFLKYLLTDTSTVVRATLTGTVDLSAGANINGSVLVVEADALGVDTVTFALADPINVNTIASEINSEVGVNIATASGNFLRLYSPGTVATGFVKAIGGSSGILTTLGLAARTEWNYTRLAASRNLPIGLSVEVSFTDINLHTLFKGSKVNSWSMDISPNAVVSGSFEFISREGGEDYVGTQIGTAYTSDFSDKFDSFTGELLIDGVAESRLRSFSMNVTNNMQGDFVTVYQKLRDDIPEGKRNISGSMTVKFDNLDFVNRAKNFAVTAINVKMENISDNRFIRVTIPRARIQLPNFDIPEGAVDLPIDFIASRDPVLGTDVVVHVGSGEAI